MCLSFQWYILIWSVLNLTFNKLKHPVKGIRIWKLKISKKYGLQTLESYSTKQTHLKAQFVIVSQVFQMFYPYTLNTKLQAHVWIYKFKFQSLLEFLVVIKVQVRHTCIQWQLYEILSTFLILLKVLLYMYTWVLLYMYTWELLPKYYSSGLD